MAEKKEHAKSAEEPVEKHSKSSLPTVKLPHVLRPFQGFVDFVRTQGVVGLAVGIVLGAQIKTLVDSFVASFVNPLLGLMLPGGGDLATHVLRVTINDKTAVFTWGIFMNQLVSFMIVAFIVYLFVHGLKLDQLDKKKDK